MRYRERTRARMRDGQTTDRPTDPKRKTGQENQDCEKWIYPSEFLYALTGRGHKGQQWRKRYAAGTTAPAHHTKFHTHGCDRQYLAGLLECAHKWLGIYTYVQMQNICTFSWVCFHVHTDIPHQIRPRIQKYHSKMKLNFRTTRCFALNLCQLLGIFPGDQLKNDMDVDIKCEDKPQRRLRLRSSRENVTEHTILKNWKRNTHVIWYGTCTQP